MNTFVLCASCACHIRTHETACPFCGAATPARSPARAPTGPRRSRAQWLALGSTLVTLGCSSGSADPTGQQQASTTADGGADVAEAAARQPCGTTTCDEKTEYCVYLNYIAFSCQPNTTCEAGTNCVCAASNADAFGFGNGGSCGCFGDDGGVSNISCEYGPPGIGPCYGSPPARLERLSTG